MKLLLSKYTWYNQGNIHVTGFIRKGDQYLRGPELAAYFSNVSSPDAFRERLLEANGQFAVVVTRSDEAWIAVDRLRSIPLFYYTAVTTIISDSAYTLYNEISSPEINEEAVTAFVSMGYTLNNVTLIKGIYQVEVGEIVVLNREITRRFYHNTATTTIYERSIDQCSAELHVLLEDIFRSHFLALKDSFIALPLSGGYDSRLIALMCKKYHPERVLCYTYGREDNPEFAPAEEIARRLGFQWVKIVYNDDLIDGFVEDPLFRKYYRYASEFASMFFMQEYFAVKYLRDKKLIPEETFFVPGHAGNIIGGDHLVPALKSRIKTEKDLTNEILRIFSYLIRLTRCEKEKICSQISEKICISGNKTWTVFENWDIKERQSKFIVNSASVYNYFGYQYIIPYWDSTLIDFFSLVPFDYKLNKKVYNYTLINTFFEPAGLNLDKELYPGPFQLALINIKKRIKKILPSFIVTLFIDHRSLVFYDGISKHLIKDGGSKNFRVPPESNNYNSYLTQWYLIKVREMVAKKLSVEK
jgi:asparagine synthase (glutamine-hydrolysing)